MAPGSPAGVDFNDFERDFDALLRDQGGGRAALEREHELNFYRSGSAPPTVEGARAAAAGLFAPPARATPPEALRLGTADGLLSEEEIRSHPAYLSYYYNENLNPRLPPPTLSREDWRAAQRLRTGVGRIGDRRQRKESRDVVGGGSSLFSVQPGIPEAMEPGRMQQQNPLGLPPSGEWLARGNDGLIGLGPRRVSIADKLQEDFGQPTYISGQHTRPVSRNAFNNIVDPMRQLHNDLETLGNMHAGATSNGLVRVQSLGSTASHSFGSAPGSSMARSTTPDPQLIRRSTSPCLHAVGGGRVSDTDRKILSNGFGGVSSCMSDRDDMAVALSGLKLSDKVTEDGPNHLHAQRQRNFMEHPESQFSVPSDQSQYTYQNISNIANSDSSGSQFPLRMYNDFPKESGILKDVGLSASTSNGHNNMPKRLSSSELYKNVAVGSTSLARSNGNYQTSTTNIDFGGCNLNAFSANQGLPMMLNNQTDTGAALAVGAEGQYVNTTGNHAGSGFQSPLGDSLYAQHLRRASDSAGQTPASPNAPLGRNYRGTSLMDLPGYQEAYLEALLAQQKLQYGSPFLGKSGVFDNGLYGNPAFGPDMPYPHPLSGPVISSVGPGSSLRSNERISRFPSVLRSATGGSKGSWNHENGIAEESFASSLLEELKNNKSRSFELSEIVGHVVEFSGDQFGSRFIQQKLETASVEEKNSIFPEILPHARVLMTDVFGNYVIQKFFEYGTESQRNLLADALIGYVLPLSLQMYGCRVIQKALEVVDVDQQTKMVKELDGSVMKCVRDQNGNHVIQKCIECVPQEKIQFIISSFYGQVVALSTHPYGCRVIQRVLEHCDDTQTQSVMMEEILQSVCTLAQDQYGNYVVQHVLQHGKSEERSSIISKLAGQIVKMSQQKFASNVVEKCLTYGTAEEREHLIDEILGSTTDENDPLQAMMKDQFGNYVVQKVLESCDDQKLGLIISRIKNHLAVLKKYTYGKHIVARVEKLIATGERRIEMSANAA